MNRVPLPQAMRSTPSSPLSKEAINQAWQHDERESLFDLIHIEMADWRTGADVLFEVLDTNGVTPPIAAELAQQLEDKLRAVGKGLRADRWFSYIVPRVLHLTSGSGFTETAYIVHATTVVADNPAAITRDTPWAGFERWLDRWTQQTLDFAVTKSDLLAALQERRLIPAASRPDNETPTIFHPLILRSLRRLLLDHHYEPAVLPICKWLGPHSFEAPHLSATVETAFGAGPLILDLAKANGIIIGTHQSGSASEWHTLTELVLDTMVINSEATAGVLAAWKGRQARIQELLDKCVYWQQAPLVDELRRRARIALDICIGELNDSLEKTNAELQLDWFSPGFESDAAVALPERRGGEAFWKDDTWNNPQKDEYTKLLKSMQDHHDSTRDNLKATVQITKAVAGCSQAFDDVFASPLAKAAFVQRAGNIDHDLPFAGHPLLATFIGDRIKQAGYRSAMFDPQRQLLTESPAWTNAVNSLWTNATDASIADHRDFDQLFQVWAALELWDDTRAQFSVDGQQAQDLIARLPDWLVTVVDPPTKVSLADIRPALAAVTQNISLPPDNILGQRLNALLRGFSLDGPVLSMLAAARLDLGLTQLVSGVAPGVAFEQLVSSTDELSELLDWALLALRSPIAWESHTGMNTFILLSRLAETTDDIVLAHALNLHLQRSETRFVGVLVQESTRKLLREIQGISYVGSKLPLAFVASDLTRYARTRAAGIIDNDPNSLIITSPIWLPTTATNGKTTTDADGWLSQFTQTIGEAQLQNLRGFIGHAGLPARLLLLAVFQLHLDRFERNRRLSVRAVRRDDVQPLVVLRRAVRAVFCTEHLLLHGSPALVAQDPNDTDTADNIIPWWTAQFWCGTGALNDVTTKGQLPVNPNRGASMPIVNWLSATSAAASLHALMTAAVLEVTVPPVPPVPPDIDLSTNRDGSRPVLVYHDRFLRDFDRRIEGEFPVFSWATARKKLGEQVEQLKQAEQTYLAALRDQLADTRSDAMIRWLKQPLQLSTADFQEQIAAAIAEVRQAEAEVEVAQHESVAALLDQAAAELIYEAAKVEVGRQETLAQAAELDKHIAQMEQDIADIQQKVSIGQLAKAEGDKEIAKKRIAQAEAELKKATMAKAQLQNEIDMLKRVLGDPNASPTMVDRGDGISEPANGQLAGMAVRVQYSLSKKLEDAQNTAQTQLKRAEREARRSFWGKLVKGVCTAIGTIVGAVLGGPAGMALGAALGQAVGELGMGMIEGKPAGDILFGLIDNAFAISGAAGFDLEKELNSLGAKGLAEVDALLDTAERSLGHILDSLPKVFDEKLLMDAFAAMGLEDVPEIANLATSVFDALKQDLGSFSGAVSAGGGLGTILRDAAKFSSPEAFRKHLSDTLFEKIFTATGQLTDQAKALARAVGKDIEALGTMEGQRKVAERVAALVVTNLGKEGPSFRTKILSEWIQAQQVAKRTWNDAEMEANELLDSLFPEPQVRAEVEASLRSALLDPETKRAFIQGYIAPWQKELDDKLQGMAGQAPEPVPDDPVATATANVNYLQAVQERFQQDVIPFLKSDPGHSAARDALYTQLDNLSRQLEQMALDIQEAADEVGIARTLLANAEITIDQQRMLLEAAQTKVRQMDLGIQKATVMSHVVELSQLKAGYEADARDKASTAAEERVKAARSRINACQAALDARKAFLLAAKERGAEAFRVRTAISRPPLSVPDVPGYGLAKARREHSERLEVAFKAYRELVRFYVSIGAPDPTLAARPDEMAGKRFTTWGSTLEAWLAGTTDSFEADGIVQPILASAVDYDLTAGQIAALTSPEGFRLMVRPTAFESLTETRVSFEVPSTLWSSLAPGLLSASWRTVFARNGIELAADAEFDPNKSQIVNKFWREVSTFDDRNRAKATWRIEGAEIYTVKVKGRTIEVAEVNEYRSMFADRIIEGVDDAKLRYGRVVGVFLTIPDPTRDGEILGDADYKIEARHLGDFFLSEKELEVRFARTMNELLPTRLFFIKKDQRPEAALLEKAKLEESEGDPQQFTVQGMPLAGTTILRLVALGGQRFHSVKLRVLYKYYNYVRVTTAARVSASTGAVV